MLISKRIKTSVASSLTFGETSFPTASSLAAGALVYNSSGTLTGFSGSAQGSVPQWHVASSAFLDSIRAWDIQTTSTDAVVLGNTTEATAGATVQYSPALQMSGSAWNSTGGSSTTHRVRMELRPATATTSTSAVHWLFGTNAGAFSSKGNLDNGGNLRIEGSTNSVGNVNVSSTGSMRVLDYALGLGNAVNIGVYATSDIPLALFNRMRGDAASSIVCSICYDRNAASITNAASMRGLSIGFTNNADAYIELFAHYLDGHFWAAKAISCAGDIGTAIASTTTLSNATVAAGAQSNLINNGPATYSATPTWAQHYHNGVKGIIPFYPII